MTFRILGPMDIRTADGDQVAVGGPRQRSLLALLLLNAGRVVTTEQLIDDLYGQDLPTGVANALQSQVSRLRRSLRTGARPDGPIEFHPAGYLLAVDPDDVDAHRFTRLAAAGRRALTATSREALGITGESLCPLAPLAVAPEDSTPEGALDYPAVRLFVERAAAVRPGFTADADTLGPILRVCAGLDGLPLAIELAAARLRSLSIDEVALRLADRFRLLSRGDRTAVARHRTLHAVVEWSWGLLDEAERELARRLPVFAGTFTLDAVAGVCGLDAEDADELLQSLADKSLVDAPGNGRYRLLDTIREFCAERLAEAGEADALYKAHARHYAELARVADPYLRRAEQLVWRDRLVAEHDNLLAALHRSVRTNPARAMLMISALTAYWWMRGQRSEATAPANDLLDAIGADAPARLAPADDPRALDDAYVLCVVYAMGAAPSIDDRLRAHVERAEAMMRDRTEAPRQPLLTYLWAMSTGPSDVVEAADPRTIGPDPWSQALYRLGAGYVLLYGGGGSAEAESMFEAAAAGFRGVGERWGLATSLEQLADFADWRGDTARADALSDEALDLLTLLDAVEDTADLLCRRAARLVRGGAFDAATVEYERAAETARRARTAGGLAGARLGLGNLARLRGDVAEGHRLLMLALKGCVSGWVTSGTTRAAVLVALGRVAEAEGNARGARTRHREALGVVIGGGIVPVASEAAEGLAGADLLDGNGERAALFLGIGAALRGARATGDPDVDRVTAGARALIGDRAFASAYERGVTMSREDALVELGYVPPVPAG
ncbi:AfsR/SARP family transcriptional regulator [Embleya sp. NBC_00896]|uniref:AfsR/SARP family transcriptional regulator n=1 Tax=Embleya sp. NBC_00896 TaxID=2975961 RepID=UPI0038634E40|nr:winged helix-turn-helix domain-containing protein [Embleya sp. NBC_00896]